jgi:4-amino-4-deoxy-L-arabinose transferase-like glycosyltransferase
VLLIGYTGTRVFNAATGFFAALVLACAPYWNLMGHFNTLDMALSFWMQLTLCALLLAQRPGLPAGQVRLWMWVCWASMALAVLSKGLVGLILPGAVLVLYTFIARDWALWKRLYLVSGLIIFFAIVSPWFILVQQRNPEFFNFFFIVQQFRRYLTPEQNRPGPLWYFIPVVVIGFLPWLSVSVKSLRHALASPRQPNGFAPVTLMLVWSVFIFLFFSISHSKLVSYVLPIAPPLALLIGLYLPLMTREQWRRHLGGYMFLCLALALGSFVLTRFGDARNPNALYREFQVWVFAASAVGFVVTAFGLWLNRAPRTPATGAAAPAVALGTAWLLLATIAGTGHDTFGTLSSGAPLAPAVRAAIAKLPPDTPFYSVGVLDHTLPFYVRHTMTMVAVTDELKFGIDEEPQKWVPTIDAWKSRWQAARYALALMPVWLYDELAAQGLPMQVIARDARRVVVERPPQP